MLKLINYSDKSIAVVGEGTKEYKDKLAELGGRYNKNLNQGPGWIFSIKHTEKVQSFLDEIGNRSSSEEQSDSEPENSEAEDNILTVKKFCRSLSEKSISETRKIFTELDQLSQKLFLHWGFEILSHKSKYSDDTYMLAYRLFRLFRGKDGSDIASYKKYSKMPEVDKLYSIASNWKDKLSKPTPPKAARTKPTPAKAARSKPTSAKAARTKYDKEYQKYPEPESEIDPLYIYYTSLFKEKPESKLAIVWLTEHGIFEGDERDELVDEYKKIK
jgi:hypothetical protein